MPVEAEPPSLIRKLLQLQREKRTGVVDVVYWDLRTAIYLSEGTPVFAQEGTVSETLGRLLTRENLLSEEQYNAALNRMTELRTLGMSRRFGEIVVELGFLRPDQVHQALASQLRYKVARCLQWDDAQFHFKDGDPRVGTVTHFPTPVEALISAATPLFERPRLEAIVRPDAVYYPEVKGDLPTVVQTMRLSNEESLFLHLLDGSRSVRDILATFQPASVDPLAILAALLLAELVETRPTPRVLTEQDRARFIPPAPESKRTVTAQKAEATAVTSAKEGRKKERAGDIVIPDEIFRALGDAEEGRLVAEQAFQLGKRLLRVDRVADARKLLARSLELYPEGLEYELYSQWAELRLEKNPTIISANTPGLLSLATTVVRKDPNCAFAFYVLGHLSLREGNYVAAERFFTRADKLDPHSHERDDSIEERRSLVPSLRPSGAEVSGAPAVPHVVLPAATLIMTGRPSIPFNPLASLNPPPVVLPPTQGTPAPADAPSEELLAPPPARPRRTALVVVGAAIVGALAIGGFFFLREDGSDRESSGGPLPTANARTSSSTTSALAAQRTMAAYDSGVYAHSALDDLVDAALARVHAGENRAAATLPSADPVPSSTSSAAASASVLPPIPPAPSSAPSSPARSSAPTAANSGNTAPMDPTMGRLRPPPTSRGRRLYVDGHVVGQTPTPVQVACGKHTVKIGSGGTSREVDVPCGGEIDVQP